MLSQIVIVLPLHLSFLVLHFVLELLSTSGQTRIRLVLRLFFLFRKIHCNFLSLPDPFYVLVLMCHELVL